MSWESHLNEPLGSTQSDIFSILRKTMGEAWNEAPTPITDFRDIWTAEMHGLDGSSIFCDLSQEKQSDILASLNQHLLIEALFIEKCGIYSAARLSLLSQKPEEKMLYNYFSADESLHFFWFSSLWEHRLPATFNTNSFLVLMESVARTHSRHIVINVLQVVLEGWGIKHYHHLGHTCAKSDLKTVFQKILKDEVRHHGGGRVIADSLKLTPSDQSTLLVLLKQILTMIRVGPITSLETLAKYGGPLTFEERLKFYREIDAEERVAQNLNHMQKLIASLSHGNTLSYELEEFVIPPSCEEMLKTDFLDAPQSSAPETLAERALIL